MELLAVRYQSSKGASSAPYLSSTSPRGDSMMYLRPLRGCKAFRWRSFAEAQRRRDYHLNYSLSHELGGNPRPIPDAKAGVPQEGKQRRWRYGCEVQANGESSYRYPRL